MASIQTSFDSMLRRFDENRTRHDEFQRSLEELKDMIRTLLVMETSSSSIIRSVPIPPHRSPAPAIAPIPAPPNPPMRGVSQADMRFAEAASSVVRPSPIHPNRRQDWFQDQELRNYGGGGILDIPSDEMHHDLQDYVDSESPRQLEEVRRGAAEEMEIEDSGSLNQNLQGISTSLTPMGCGHKQDSTPEIVVPVEEPSEILDLQKLVVEEFVQEADDDQTMKELKKASVESEASGLAIEEDPKELQQINDGIVETEAMHHVMLFYPLPEGNTQSPELEIVVGNIRWKRVVEGSAISMESLEFWNAYQVFVEMPKRKPEVNSMNECNSFENMTIDADPKGMGDMIQMSIKYIEFDMDDLRTNSYAHKVLEKMSKNDIAFMDSSFHYSLRSVDFPSRFVFDPGKINGIVIVFNLRIACAVEVELHSFRWLIHAIKKMHWLSTSWKHIGGVEPDAVAAI